MEKSEYSVIQVRILNSKEREKGGKRKKTHGKLANK